MERAVRALLEAADDAEGFEVPANDWEAFPYKVYEQEILEIQHRLHDDLGLVLQRDGNVQDASFLDDLRILSSVPDQPNTFVVPLCIRFSNFGKLFTVWSSLDSIPSEYPLADIVVRVEGFGWRYVPVEELDEPYDGRNERLRGANTSWWARFFDWV